MSLTKLWANYFQNRVRQNGRAYFLSGRVTLQTPEEGQIARAVVRGSREYDVRLIGSASVEDVSCTCEAFGQGYYCKHLWAVMLAEQKRRQDAGPRADADQTHAAARGPRPAHAPDRAADPAGANLAPDTTARLGAQENGVLPMPKAKRRGGDRDRRAADTRKPSDWIAPLSLLRASADRLGQRPLASVELLAAAQRQLVYVVHAERSRRCSGLVVEVRERQSARGGWSAPRPVRVAPERLAQMPDPADRELLGILLGGRPAEDPDSDSDSDSDSDPRAQPGRFAFALAEGVRRSVLKRLVASGRCLLLDADDQWADLRWDPDESPWALWMTAEEDDREARVRVELRRDGQRTPIERPALIVGGIDGLVIDHAAVAPFDDRGALEWVLLFRDTLRGRGGHTPDPIRVPLLETERFIEHLYRLANLPELDLPATWSLRECKVAVVPRLDIRGAAANPSAAPAANAPAASARSLLSAHLAYDYDGTRVRVGQPGRFVLASPLSTDLAEPRRPGDDRAITLTDHDPLPDRQAPPTEHDPASDTPTDGNDPTIGDRSTPAASPGDAAADLDDPTRTDGQDDDLAPTGSDPADSDSDSDSDPDSDPEADADPDADLAEVPSAPEMIRRDLRRENEALALLLRLGLRPSPTLGPDAFVLRSADLPDLVPGLLADGWIVTADRHALRTASAPVLSVTTGIDWFELRGGVTYHTEAGEQSVSLPDILAAARAGRRTVTLGDGSQGLLPEEWLRRHGLLTTVAHVEGDHLRFRLSQAALLDSLLAQQVVVDVDARFDELRQRLRRFDRVSPVEPGGGFVGTLRHYQKEGLGWLAFLREFGFGGVLADDMGLGKTVQVLALLEGLYRPSPPTPPSPAPNTRRPPTLVVAPRSVVYNWIDEAQRFVPDLRVAPYVSSDHPALRAAIAQSHILVTTYGLLRRDIGEMRRHDFELVVLDEAQTIKNASSQGAKAARLLKAPHRLALTGTPVENHLGDLWSIFEFLNPGMLGSGARFAELVREAGKIPERLDTAMQAGRALRPFILRRTKKQVLSELPTKTEQTILCEMEPAQRQVYDELLKHYRGQLLGRFDALGIGRDQSVWSTPTPAPGSGGSGNGSGGGGRGGRRKPPGGGGGGAGVGGGAGGNGSRAAPFMVLEALLRLRQAACHPALIDPKRESLPSAKLDALMEQLTELIDEGHKALIFSQFTSMLALLRKRLDAAGLVYEYLDGQTRQRQQRVHRFQNDPGCPLFLISLKAGGLGLNLTAAEYVFILDPWWNPAVESQAIDRAHRIGQTKPVFAYRLVCRDTVEQRIIDLQARKRKLAEAIIGGQESLLRSLTRDDLEKLLS